MIHEETEADPLILICREEGTWFVENHALSIVARGHTLGDAILDFVRDLEYLRSRYAALGDDELSASGQRLRSRLEQFPL